MKAICKADYDKRLKTKENTEKEAEKDRSVKIPQVGFHDIYGVWFFGNLCGVIREVHLSKYGIGKEKMMHVFIDIEPEIVPDGIHNITVYGHQCQLYKWKAQGYHRGLVVLMDDICGCAAAQVYMESGTWSWLLNDENKAKLQHQTNNCAVEDSIFGDDCPPTGPVPTRG